MQTFYIWLQRYFARREARRGFYAEKQCRAYFDEYNREKAKLENKA